MDLRAFFTVFASVFVAELGDKTQLATLLYASDARASKLTVFAASASALVLTSALGVLAGGVISEYVSPRVLRWLAGGGFIAVGCWILLARGE
jgi:putative Ca2+/H+ antiporter (TMEM165/GDT1 family)